MSANSGNRQAQADSLPLWGVLFFNLAILIALAVLCGLKVSSKCVSSTGVGLSLAIVALELFHLTWRYLGQALLQLAIHIGPVEIQIGQFAALFEQLHPRSVPDWILGIQALVLFVIAGILWFPASSPFSSDQVPVIQYFLVHYTNSETERYAPGSLLQIAKGTMVLVEAETSGQPGISCAWSTTNGFLLPVGKCATQYSTPIEGNRDTLAVSAKSPCKTYLTFAGLHIEVLEDEP